MQGFEIIFIHTYHSLYIFNMIFTLQHNYSTYKAKSSALTPTPTNFHKFIGRFWQVVLSENASISKQMSESDKKLKSKSLRISWSR